MLGSSPSFIPLPSKMNFIPFHSIGLWDEEIIIPAPYFLDSLNTTGVGTIPKSNTSIPFFIRTALTVS